eukprot:TRINITY_DN150_c0_g1_i6.p1 TRINITY_DN150_c0_g1~~TRINITY_DN150_c0_g1_i6.p1  ORF type:complete len:488 (-),score=64.01 TRINITY_DN150_c0_g1_i6:51-1514(-)
MTRFVSCFFVASMSLAIGISCDDSQLEEHVSFLQHGKTFALMQSASGIGPEAYYWSSRGGDPATSSSVSYVAPSNFSRGPSWVWQNELKEQVRHSPLIDADKNIYVSTTTRLRKFTSNGDIMWTWHAAPDTRVSAAPALHNGRIYVVNVNKATRVPTVFSISMLSGIVHWNKTYGNIVQSGDAESVKVFNDTIIFGAITNKLYSKGTDTVIAASAADGTMLWQYAADAIMWNFSPSTPGDGSILFSGSCGTVFRISSEGDLIWKAGPSSNPDHPFCTMAGGALGPNGVFYSMYSVNSSSNNNKLAAYNVTDGALLWSKHLPYHALQYPAVGHLGAQGPLVVAVPLGDGLSADPMAGAAKLARAGGALRNMVLVVDAATGQTMWQSEERPWPHAMAAGEFDEHNVTDGAMCLPDPQGIPVISGDGTIYTSSSHHGDLRALRDADGDGTISQWEISVFKTGKCFLNSPSLAPGMLVAAPCWGPMYVFKE